MINKRISIIIPCRNEERYIGQCIQSFIDMDFENDKMEIIIVDGCSEDNSVLIINEYQKKFPFIQLITNSEIFTPFGLNLGINNAKYEYIMIASAHARFARNYLNEVFRVLTELKADAAGGVMITEVKNKTEKTLSICKVFSNKFGVGNSIFRTGSEKIIQVDTVPFGVYRTDLLKEAGLYDERLIRNHDIELSKRIISKNKKICLVPSAQCTYFIRETFRSIAKNNFNNGFWNILTVYITKKLSSISFRHFIPLFFLLSIILPIILMIFFPLLGFVAAFSLVIYFLTILLVSLQIKDKNSSFYYIFWTFLVLHFSYGFGSLIGLFMVDYLLKSDKNKKYRYSGE